MSWLIQNRMVVLVIAALLSSIYVARQDTRRVANETRSALIESCVRESAQWSLTANGFALAAERKHTEHDLKTEARYKAVADGMIYRIVAPVGHLGDRHMAETTLLRDSGRRERYVISERAKALQMAGCERAIP